MRWQINHKDQRAAFQAGQIAWICAARRNMICRFGLQPLVLLPQALHVGCNSINTTHAGRLGSAAARSASPKCTATPIYRPDELPAPDVLASSYPPAQAQRSCPDNAEWWT